MLLTPQCAQIFNAIPTMTLRNFAKDVCQLLGAEDIFVSRAILNM